MPLSPKQTAELDKPLDPRFVAKRSQSGRSMSYVEGWHVIAEANRIFGFDGWHRETTEMREVRPAEEVTSSGGKKTWRVGFIAKVRVTVGEVVREGTGYGSGALPDLGEAYESAVKEAETDAMKRALMTFGNPFGLALYDKSQSNVRAVEDEPDTTKRDAYLAIANQRIEMATDPDALKTWWADEKDARRFAGLQQEDVDTLKNEVIARVAALTQKKEAA